MNFETKMIRLIVQEYSKESQENIGTRRFKGVLPGKTHADYVLVQNETGPALTGFRSGLLVEVESSGVLRKDMYKRKVIVVTAYREVEPEGWTELRDVLGGFNGLNEAMITDMFRAGVKSLTDAANWLTFRCKGRRWENVAAAIRMHAEVLETAKFFQEMGQRPEGARRTVKRLRGGAIPQIKENPYILAERVEGFSVSDAYTMEAKLSGSHNKNNLSRAAAVCVVKNAVSQGHMFLNKEDLVSKASANIGQLGEFVGYLDLLSAIDSAVSEKLLKNKEDRLYISRYSELEERCSRLVSSMCDGKSPLEGPRDEELASFLGEHLKIALDPEQISGVQNALDYRMSVITGGPGRGKTTVIKALELVAEANGYDLLLSAPTAKAVKRIKQLTDQPVLTLAKMLGADGDGRIDETKSAPIDDAEIVGVDEFSMCDIRVFEKLLAKARRKHLVFIGDPDQLESVGPGSVLFDLIHSGKVPITRLVSNHRQLDVTGGITRLMDSVVCGRVGFPQDYVGSDVLFFDIDPEKIPDWIVSMIMDNGKTALGTDKFSLGDFMVLSPYNRKGPCSAEALGERIQSAVLAAASGFEIDVFSVREGGYVFQTRNDYTKGIMNGDMGSIQKVDPERGVAEIDFDGNVIEYVYSDERNDFVDLRLAYVTTIHKAQGSEFPAVIIPLIEGCGSFFSRHMAYTAISRAKAKLVLVGKWEILQRAALMDNMRNSHLKEDVEQIAERSISCREKESVSEFEQPSLFDWDADSVFIEEMAK